jgi:hypothetical protein
MSTDGVLRGWLTDPEALLGLAEARAPRSLTRAERQKYAHLLVPASE